MKNNTERKPDHSRASKKERTGKEEKRKPLPGEYPPQEDIMNRRDTERVGLDVENFSRTIGQENFNKPGEPLITKGDDILEFPQDGVVEDPESSAAKEMEWPVPKDMVDEEEVGSTNESDVTPDDLQALGPKDLSMDMGDDENLLKNRVYPVDMSGKDLDIPGTELDDDREAIGSEDEENNSYSIGGDRHEDNMEGK